MQGGAVVLCACVCVWRARAVDFDQFVMRCELMESDWMRNSPEDRTKWPDSSASVLRNRLVCVHRKADAIKTKKTGEIRKKTCKRQNNFECEIEQSGRNKFEIRLFVIEREHHFKNKVGQVWPLRGNQTGQRWEKGESVRMSASIAGKWPRKVLCE